MVVKVDEIRKAIDDLVSSYDGKATPVSFGQVLQGFPAIGQAYQTADAIFGSGNVNPTATTPASGVAEFAYQYLDSLDIDALKKSEDSIIATELYDVFMKKFSTGLYGLFSSVQEINRKYGGLDPDANQISDEIIIPSFIKMATTTDTVNGLPANVSGSFAQPAVNFKNTLSNKSTTAEAVVGWVNHYFTVDSTLSASALYSGSPSLDKTTAFVVFGALDREGNIGGIKFANAKNNYTKPVYFGHAGLDVGDTTTQAHVMNNGMSMYIGQSTYGYVGVDLVEPIPKGKGTTTTTDGTLDVNVDLLGLMFSIAPTIQNNLY